MDMESEHFPRLLHAAYFNTVAFQPVHETSEQMVGFESLLFYSRCFYFLERVVFERFRGPN